MEHSIKTALWLSFFTYAYSGTVDCPPGYFMCTSEMSCLPKSFIFKRVCPDARVFGSEGFTSDCNALVTGRSYGWLSSPNYPQPYSPGRVCRWLVKLGRYNRIQLRKETVDLGPGDMLIIYDGPNSFSKKLGIFQGSARYLTTLTSTGGEMLIELHSRNLFSAISLDNPEFSFAYRGFNLTYQILGVCIPHLQRACSKEPGCYDLRHDRCNGAWNCPLYGSDELGCKSCRSDQYFCPLGASCYTARERCDGKANCRDGLDEKHCDSRRCGAHNGTFLCPSGRCIFESWVCDGATDCPDGADELACPPKGSSKRVVLAAVVGSLLCGLVVILAAAYVCRLHALRTLARARSTVCQFDSPLQRMVEAELQRRRPPPGYDEAMRTSRSFDEVCRELRRSAARWMVPTSPGQGCDNPEEHIYATISRTEADDDDDDVPLIDPGMVTEESTDIVSPYATLVIIQSDTVSNPDDTDYDVPLLDTSPSPTPDNQSQSDTSPAIVEGNQ